MGGLYQIAGILCAATGIAQTRQAWSQVPGIAGTSKRLMETFIRAICLTFLRLFPRFKKTHTAEPGSAMTGASGGIGALDATVSHQVPEDISGRVRWLLSHVQSLTTQVSSLEEQLREGKANLAGAIDDTHDRLSGLESRTTSQVTSLATGGLRLQSWGVLFLVLGAIQIMVASSSSAPPNGALLISLIVILCWATAIAFLTLNF